MFVILHAVGGDKGLEICFFVEFSEDISAECFVSFTVFLVRGSIRVLLFFREGCDSCVYFRELCAGGHFGFTRWSGTWAADFACVLRSVAFCEVGV